MKSLIFTIFQANFGAKIQRSNLVQKINIRILYIFDKKFKYLCTLEINNKILILKKVKIKMRFFGFLGWFSNSKHLNFGAKNQHSNFAHFWQEIQIFGKHQKYIILKNRKFKWDFLRGSLDFFLLDLLSLCSSAIIRWVWLRLLCCCLVKPSRD